VEKKEKKKPILVGPDGRIYQKNEGKWKYKWEDSKKCIRLLVDISKFLDTSHIKVDVHPDYINILIKDKVLQLLFEENVVCNSMHCERSKLTGQLAITLQKESYKDPVDISKELNKMALDVSVTKPVKVPIQYKRYSNLRGCVDFRNIARNQFPTKKTKEVIPGIEEKQKLSEMEDEFIDDPSVPPLC
jgi:protein TilB